jgi:hypothetical protein
MRNPFINRNSLYRKWSSEIFIIDHVEVDLGEAVCDRVLNMFLCGKQVPLNSLVVARGNLSNLNIDVMITWCSDALEDPIRYREMFEKSGCLVEELSNVLDDGGLI